MKYSFIFAIFKFFIETLKLLSLVELFKFIAVKINKNHNNDAIYKRWAVDIFIVLKWTFVLVIFTQHCHGAVLTILVWYFIITNLFTYFYYHIWDEEALNTENFEKDRIRRRFINSMLAIAYSVLCFAYLYQLPYSGEFSWPKDYICSEYSLIYSFSNSLAANYEEVKPITDVGNLISNLELFISFTFITIIISRSIPQTNSNT